MKWWIYNKEKTRRSNQNLADVNEFEKNFEILMYFCSTVKISTLAWECNCKYHAVTLLFRTSLLQTKPNSWIIYNGKHLRKISISEVFIYAKVEAGPGQVKLQEGVERGGGAQEQAEAGEGQQVLLMNLVI